MAASSLHHGNDFLSEDQKALIEKTYCLFTSGLSLNIDAKNPETVVQNLIEKGFKDEKDLIICHDVVNNGICKHKSNFEVLTVPNLIEVLNLYQN